MTTAPSSREHRPVTLMKPARYIPLAFVTAATIVTGSIGFMFTVNGATSNTLGTPAPPAAPPVLEIVESEEERTLPTSCSSGIPLPENEPWGVESASDSDAVWQENSEALGQPFVLGESGYVFWGDVQNNNFSQAVGRRTLSADELQLWTDSLRSVRDQLQDRGISFYIVPTPAKWDVYPELLPAWARGIDGSGPLDQLLAAAPDLPIIDLRADLRTAALEYPVYSSVNSHWSDYGAWVGWKSIASCIGAHETRFSDLGAPPITGVSITEGGNEFAPWGLSAPQADWSVPILSAPLAPTVLTIDGERPETRTNEQRVGLDEMPATTLTPGATSSEPLLLVRDSMGVSLSPWAQQSFENTRQIRHAFDLGDPSIIPDIVGEATLHSSSIVILQLAQRHLNAPPDLRG